MMVVLKRNVVVAAVVGAVVAVVAVVGAVAGVAVVGAVAGVAVVGVAVSCIETFGGEKIVSVIFYSVFAVSVAGVAFCVGDFIVGVIGVVSFMVF